MAAPAERQRPGGARTPGGDRHGELLALGKTLGSTRALLGLTSTCDSCGDVREEIQQVIDLAAGLRALALHDSYTPDGVIFPM